MHSARLRPDRLDVDERLNDMDARRDRLEFMVEEGFLDAETIFLEGFDEAIIGTVELFRKEGHVDVVAYDYNECISLLCERDGMDPDEAIEYFEFNVIDAYAGPGTPAFVHPLDDEGERGVQR